MQVVSLVVLLASLVSLVSAQSNNSATYTNPILDAVGADPWVIRYEGYYYMTYTTSDNITILRSSVLTDWNNADVKLAFEPPTGQKYSTDLYGHLLSENSTLDTNGLYLDGLRSSITSMASGILSSRRTRITTSLHPR